MGLMEKLIIGTHLARLRLFYGIYSSNPFVNLVGILSFGIDWQLPRCLEKFMSLWVVNKRVNEVAGRVKFLNFV